MHRMLKNLFIFGLWVFGFVWISSALNIQTNIDNAVLYIKKIVLTPLGTDKEDFKVRLNGVDWSIIMLWDMKQYHFGNGSTSSTMKHLMARGVRNAPKKVEIGDQVFMVWWYWYDWSKYMSTAAIKFIVDGTVWKDTVWANDIPWKILFQTTQDNTSTLVTRMVLDNLGNVGIGVDKPLAKLHINVDSDSALTALNIKNINRGANGKLRFAMTSNKGNQEARALIQVENYGSNNDAILSFWTQENQKWDIERMRIDNVWNVGIGTTNPGAKLHVNWNIRTNLGVVASINNTLSVNYIPKADSSYRLTESQIYDNGTYVGIGMAALNPKPNEKLTVDWVISIKAQTNAPWDTAWYHKIYGKGGELYHKVWSANRAIISIEWWLAKCTVGQKLQFDGTKWQCVNGKINFNISSYYIESNPSKWGRSINIWQHDYCAVRRISEAWSNSSVDVWKKWGSWILGVESRSEDGTIIGWATCFDAVVWSATSSTTTAWATVPKCKAWEVLSVNTSGNLECIIDTGWTWKANTLPICDSWQIIKHDDTNWACAADWGGWWGWMSSQSSSWWGGWWLDVLLKKYIKWDKNSKEWSTSNPRYVSFEITTDMLEKCRVDWSNTNQCMINTNVEVTYNWNWTHKLPVYLKQFFTTRKVWTKRYISIVGTNLYDHWHSAWFWHRSIVVWDGTPYWIRGWSWIWSFKQINSNFNWISFANQSGRQYIYTLSDAKSTTDGKLWDNSKDDKWLWITFNRRNFNDVEFSLTRIGGWWDKITICSHQFGNENGNYIWKDSDCTNGIPVAGSVGVPGTNRNDSTALVRCDSDSWYKWTKSSWGIFLQCIYVAPGWWGWMSSQSSSWWGWGSWWWLWTPDFDSGWKDLANLKVNGSAYKYGELKFTHGFWGLPIHATYYIRNKTTKRVYIIWSTSNRAGAQDHFQTVWFDNNEIWYNFYVGSSHPWQWVADLLIKSGYIWRPYYDYIKLQDPNNRKKWEMKIMAWKAWWGGWWWGWWSSLWTGWGWWSSLWTEKWANVYRTWGNVGIWLNNPLSPLHIVGNKNTGWDAIRLYNKWRWGVRQYFTNFKNGQWVSAAIELQNIQSDMDNQWRLNFYVSTAKDWLQRMLYINTNWWTYGKFSWLSDKRLKKNITWLKQSLEKVLKLKGVNFYRKEKTKGTDKQIWLIAQDVEKVVPEVVTEGADWYKAVAYSNLVALVVEAIKELATKVEKLADKYVSQAEKIQQLETKYENLQVQFDEFKAIVCEDREELCK